MRELIASTARASAGEPEHPRQISQLLKEFPHRGVAVRYRNDLGRQVLPASVAGCLYQVAHETLLNVTRHAEAKHVDVHLTVRGRDVQLVVADDGRGFSVTDVKSSGWSSFGLRTMRERVAEAGGTLHIDSRPGTGTRITAQLPLGKPLGRRTVVAESVSDHASWRDEPRAARGR
jgi:signal transduction histidine kinase